MAFTGGLLSTRRVRSEPAAGLTNPRRHPRVDRLGRRRYSFSFHLVEGPMAGDSKDLLHGTLDLLVLRALAGEPMHGFALSKWISQRTNGDLGIVDSALYKALHRLEDSGAVRAEWGVSENNRRARYYSLTVKGRRQLRDQVDSWKHYVATVAALLEPG
jgi:PadR family transcriptional regulator, regulatory protein PadR